ncbi:preprotein translocase subunit SecG [Oscillospiraceae bacterium OttesenSCG-928-F05]|nr:preprotein translocase subunit SecG [Oscillospiraceae bacterium OttesenSCG-928-F05]
MEVVRMILTIVQVVVSVALILIVLLQSGKKPGLSGAISGAADTFMSKNKAKTWDARLAKMTTFVAVAFILLTLSLSLV